MPERRINLLILIPDIQAGTGTFCKNIAGGLKRLHPDEFTVKLLLIRPRELTGEERACFDEVHSVRTAFHGDWRRSFETILQFWRLRRAIRAIDSDIVLAIGTYSNLLASMLAGPRRTIMTEHMNMSHRLRVAPFRRIIRRLMRWRYPKSLVVAAARGITRDLEENFGAHSTLVIPNGLDAENVRRMADEPTGEPPTNRRYIVAVGRLTPQKDYPTLLRAFAAARQRGMTDELLIIGDGELRGELENLARTLKIADATHFAGQRANPYPLMKPARCLVLTSLFEGFAYVPLEAMALGLPCIATDCPSGPAEILGDGKYGILVPTGDSDAIAAAMLRLSTDDAAHAHFVQQSKIRSAELTVENMVRQYRDLFHQHLNR